MSQIENAVTSSPKRPYRKGKALTTNERKMLSLQRKRETHKEISVFVRNALKDEFVMFCEQDGLTQAQMIELLRD